MNANGIINEKEYFTKERLLSLSIWNEKIERIKHLENKFGNICLTPLDVPKIQSINHEKFVSWFYKNCKPSIKQNPDVATKAVGYSKFKSIDLIPDNFDTKNRVWSKNPISNFHKLWPDLWEQMHEYLPFECIKGFTIWNSTDDILPHRDPGIFTDFPVSFRILLNDNDPNINLFVGECFPNADLFNLSVSKGFNNKLDTNCLTWNNLRTVHWSKKTIGYDKILLIMLPWVNKINLDKYEQLIEKSLVKYQQQILKSKSPLDNWIDIDSK